MLRAAGHPWGLRLLHTLNSFPDHRAGGRVASRWLVSVPEQASERAREWRWRLRERLGGVAQACRASCRAPFTLADRKLPLCQLWLATMGGRPGVTDVRVLLLLPTVCRGDPRLPEILFQSRTDDGNCLRSAGKNVISWAHLLSPTPWARGQDAARPLEGGAGGTAGSPCWPAPVSGTGLLVPPLWVWPLQPDSGYMLPSWHLSRLLLGTLGPTESRRRVRLLGF